MRLGDLDGNVWHFVDESAKGAEVIRGAGGGCQENRCSPRARNGLSSEVSSGKVTRT